MTTEAKPAVCTDEHLDFLDHLRESGKTNMFGAGPYLRKKFKRLKEEDAKAILLHWMHTFSDRKGLK